MALLGWWPFNGNYEDYSGNKKHASAGWSFDGNGKIGQCIKRTNDSTAITLPITPAEVGNIFTVSFWIYVDSTTTLDSNKITNILLGKNDGADRSPLSYFQYPTRNDFHWSCNEQGSYDSGVLKDNTWTNVTVTYDGSKINRYYNGVLKGSSVWNVGDKYKLTSSIPLTGAEYTQINDLRIYNEVLSLKEIKEISKCLILHYPLNSSYEEATENISHTTFYSTEVNGSDYFIKNETDTWFNGMHLSSLNVTPGKYYTWSFDVKSDKKFNIGFDGNCSSNNTTGNDAAHEKMTTYPDTYDTPGVWVRVSITSKIKDDVISPWIHHSFCPRGNNLKIYTRNSQIEQKDHATPYTSKTRLLPIGDSSGFRNHGVVKTVTSPSFDTNSVLGSGCMKFNGKSTFISVGKNTVAKPTDALTFSAWAYRDNWTSSKNYRIISCTEAGGYNFECLNNGLVKPQIMLNSTYIFAAEEGIQTSKLSAGWHLFTCTYNGTKACYYVDGAKITEKQASGKITYNTSNAIFIGAEAAGNTTTPYASDGFFDGKISDVRIYATGLTESDVLNLYNEKASLLMNGKLMANELIEDSTYSNSIITKNITVRSDGWGGTSYVIIDGTKYSGGRSWNIVDIDENLKYVSNNRYDIYGTASLADDFIIKFNSIPDDHFVVIYSYDQPSQNNTKVLDLLQKYSPEIKNINWNGRCAYFLVIRKGNYKKIAESYDTYVTDSPVATTGEVTITLRKNVNSVNRESQFVTDRIDEISTLYNLPVKYQYGALWARVYYLNSKNGTVLFTADEALNIQQADKVSYLGKLEEFRGTDGKFEFLMQATHTENYNRWKQISNPTVSSSCVGYEPITIQCTAADSTYSAAFSGLKKTTASHNNCFIDGSNPNSTNWWYAVCPYVAYNPSTDIGVPYLYNKVWGGEQSLWVRIDNVPKIFKMYKNNFSSAREYVEK